MPDNKEKEVTLFSDDLPKEPEKNSEPTPPASDDLTRDSSGQEDPSTSDLPPTVDETYAAPKDLFEAIHRKDLDAVVIFLEKKSNLATTNEDEKTPLQVAAELGPIDIVKLLVECGANIEAKGKDGRTPLMLALSDSHFEVAEYLLSKGANVNTASASNYTPLMQVAAKGKAELLRDMLPKIDNLNAKNNEGRTALMIATRFGHRDVIEMLLARNASLQVTDNNGNTAISLAEDVELKNYLSQKLAEESLRATDIQKTSEEKRKGKERIPTPYLLVLIALTLLTAAFGFFSYWYYQNNIKSVAVVVSPSMQKAAALIAQPFCGKVKECRTNVDDSFFPLCLRQSNILFTRYLHPKEFSTCVEEKASLCGQCLALLPCEKLNTLNEESINQNCRLCKKVCAE